jgi:DNA-binding XRE family transcriptional regulator
MIIKKKGTNYEEFEADLLKDQEVRKEYDALNPKYEMIKRLIMQRNKMRMSQAQLAKKVGLKQPAICRLEKGSNNATLNTFIKVARALDLTIELRAGTSDRRAGRITRKSAQV